MQFLEVSPIFAREDSGRGVAAVFEGWMILISGIAPAAVELGKEALPTLSR
jgi:hypothetical protein